MHLVMCYNDDNRKKHVCIPQPENFNSQIQLLAVLHIVLTHIICQSYVLLD